MLLQGKEINGLIPFNKGRYHNLFYENMIKELNKLRSDYRFFPLKLNIYLRFQKKDIKHTRKEKNRARGIKTLE